ARRFTAGFWIWSMGESAYAGIAAQSLKSPSIRIRAEGPAGDGERMLARIGTMSIKATTAAMPVTDRDQWGWAGIRGAAGPLRRPFVNPFPLTSPFVAPRPNVRPLTRPSDTPLNRPFVRPLPLPFVRPLTRPLVRPLVYPAVARPGVPRPLERRPVAPDRRD